MRLHHTLLIKTSILAIASLGLAARRRRPESGGRLHPPTDGWAAVQLGSLTI